MYYVGFKAPTAVVISTYSSVPKMDVTHSPETSFSTPSSHIHKRIRNSTDITF